jgi:hypothetical protein
MTVTNLPRNCVSFKSEVHTRSLHNDLPDGGPVFTETEQKLISLELDPAACQGEVDNCATKLFGSLRRRGTRAEQIIRAYAHATQVARDLSAARGYVVRFWQIPRQDRRRGAWLVFALGAQELSQYALQPQARNANRIQ